MPDALIDLVSLVGPREVVAERLAAYRDAGVGTLLVSPLGYTREQQFEQLADARGAGRLSRGLTARADPERSPLRIFLGAFGQPGHAFPMLALGTAAGPARPPGDLRDLGAVARARRRRGHGVRRRRPSTRSFPTQEQPLTPYEAVVRATAPTRAAIAAGAGRGRARHPHAGARARRRARGRAGRDTRPPPVSGDAPRASPPYSIGARLPRTQAGAPFWGVFERPAREGACGRDATSSTRRGGGWGCRRSSGCTAASARALPGRDVPAARVPARVAASTRTSSARCSGSRRRPTVEPPPGDEPLVVVAPSTSHDPGQRLLRAALEGLRGSDVRVLPSRTAARSPASARTNGRARLVNWMSYGRTIGAVRAGHLPRRLTAPSPARSARRPGAGCAAQRRHGRERRPSRLGGPRGTAAVAVALATDAAPRRGARTRAGGRLRCACRGGRRLGGGQRRRHSRRRAGRGTGIGSGAAGTRRRSAYYYARTAAPHWGVAQWQSSRLLIERLWVRVPPPQLL